MAATMPIVCLIIGMKEIFVSLFVDLGSWTISAYILLNICITWFDKFSDHNHCIHRKRAQLVNQRSPRPELV